jgi:hypothetical protein
MIWFARARFFAAVGFVLVTGVAALSPSIRADRELHAAMPIDAVSREHDRYRDAVTSLPVRGTIGFLPPTERHASDATMRYFVAQYALTPRVIVLGTNAEYVIAVPEAAPADDEPTGRPSQDPRLAGFMLIERLESGIRIYKRLS